MFFKKENKSLKAVYTMHSIDGLGFSLISIFIPIYLLTFGYDIIQVLIYFIVQNTALLISTFAAGYLGSYFGIQRVLLLRLPFLFAFLIILNFLEVIAFPIYLLAIIDGLQSALYWTCLHIVFRLSSVKKTIGSSTGKLFAIPQIVTLFSPYIGGLIAAYYGFNVLFYFAIVIFLISVVPLLAIKKIEINFKIRLKNAKELYRNNKKFFYAEILNNFGEETEGIIWPLFIYLSIFDIKAVGMVGTLLAIGSFIVTLIMGRLSDRQQKKNFIKIGALLIILVWLTRYFLSSELAFYVITLISGIVFVIFSIPYYAKIYSLPNKDKVDEFFIFREVPVYLGRMICFSLAIVFIGSFQSLFPVVAIAYLYFLFFK